MFANNKNNFFLNKIKIVRQKLVLKWDLRIDVLLNNVFV